MRNILAILCIIFFLFPIGYIEINGLIIEKRQGDDWKMFRYDPAQTGNSSSSAPGFDRRALLWSYQTSSEIGASPILYDNKLYIGNRNGTVYSIDAKTGKVSWSKEFGVRISSTMSASNKKIFFGTQKKFYALNSENGNEVWNISLNETTASTVIGGKVFFGSVNGLYCVYEDNGTNVWSYPGFEVYSSPAIAGDKVIFASYNGSIYAVNRTNGANLWEKKIGANILSSPAIVNGRIFFGATDNKVYALNETNGDILWNFTTKGKIYSSPAIANGIVVIGSTDARVYAISEKDGKEIWNFSTRGEVHSSPAIANKTVFIGSCDRNIYSISLYDGTLIWNKSLLSYIYSSPAIGYSNLYICDYFGYIYAFGNSIPIAYAGSDKYVKINQPVFFDGRGNDLDGYIKLYEWDFDNDSIIDFSSEESGSAWFAYREYKNYTAKLIVSDDRGAKGEDSLNVYMNMPPSAPIVWITPEEPKTSEDLQAHAKGSIDPEGEDVSYFFNWYKNGTFEVTGEILNHSKTSKNDIWVLVVTPNDGYNNGTNGSASIVIHNSPPKLEGVDILPKNIYADTNLTAVTYGWKDDDGDKEQSIFEWFINGISIKKTSEKNVSLAIRKNDIIKVKATPYDGEAPGKSVISSEAYVSNSKPTKPEIKIIPEEAKADKNIECIIVSESIDIDYDELNYTYTWYANGIKTEINEKTIDKVRKGEIWKCVVRSYDSELFSDEATAEIMILNSKPKAQIANETLGIVGFEVFFNGSGEDPDNDIKKYDWDFDGDGNYDWSGAYGNKTWVYNSTGYYIASLRVVDEDGELDIANTTVKIINNPPVISYCPPRFGKIGDEIIFEAKDAYDPDGHEINYTWEFGDGKFGSEKIVGHRYNRKGNFTVKLIITDAYGAKGGCNFVIAIEEKNAVGKKEENYFIYIGIIFLLAGVPSLLYYRYRKKAKIVKEEIKKEEKKPEISKDELVKKMYLADALKAEKAIEMIKSVVPSKPRIRIKEIECPKCGNFVDRNWEKCIYCQAKLVEKIELKIPVGKEKCRFCGGIVEKGIIKCFNCFKTLTYPDKLSSELRNFLKEFDRIETMIDEFRREKKDIGALKKIAKKAIKYLDDDISLAMEYAKKANRIADELKSRYEIEKVKKGEKVQCSFCRNFVDSYKENCPYCSSALFPEMKEVPKIGFVCRFCKSEIESKWYVCKFCFNPLKDGKDKRFDEAVRLLIKVRTTKNPEGRLLLCKFVEEMNKRNYKEAIKCGLKIKRIEKEEVEKEKMKEEGLGEEEILGKSLEKITEKINELKVKGIKTKDAEVQVELANAFFRTKKFEKAKKYLEEAKDIIEEHL